MDADVIEEIAKKKHIINSNERLGPDFVALYRSQLLTDVILVVQAREFKVHRLILSTRSKYFNNLFNTYPCRSRIELNEVFDLETFDRILEFIYGGNIDINGATDIKELVKLERLAKRLDLNLGKVFEAKKKWLEEADHHLFHQNIVSHLKRNFALQKIAELDKCMKYLEDNLAAIYGHPDLLRLPFKILLAFVSRENREFIKIEEILVIYLFCWYSTQKEEEKVDEFILTKQMRQLFKHIKLEHIDLKKKIDVLRPKDWVSAEDLWNSHIRQVEMYPWLQQQQYQ